MAKLKWSTDCFAVVGDGRFLVLKSDDGWYIDDVEEDWDVDPDCDFEPECSSLKEAREKIAAILNEPVRLSATVQTACVEVPLSQGDHVVVTVYKLDRGWGVRVHSPLFGQVDGMRTFVSNKEAKEVAEELVEAFVKVEELLGGFTDSA